MNLFGKTLSELQQIVKELKFPRYTAKQISDWLYKKDIKEFDEMTNLSKKMRNILKNNYEYGISKYVNVQESADETKKYLFKTENEKYIESAYIPDNKRATLCVSSQAGCKFACSFCMTGQMGFNGNLSACEILNQIKSLPEKDKLTNIVFMGMGEPLDNIDELLKSIEILTSDYGFAISPRRITVSTIGIIDGLKRFLNESNCNLALSLHTPFEDERSKIMPAQKTNQLRELMRIIRKIDFSGQRRISFEYIMFQDFNDTQKHINELTRLLHGIKCRLNLIPFHQIKGTNLKGTNYKNIEIFKTKLNSKGVLTTIRKSRGMDINAACGLLYFKKLNSQKKKNIE